MTTWDELSLAQQMILEAARKHNVIVATDRDGVLAPYEWPHAAFEKFITDGYLEQFGIGTSYYTRYRLTPAGRALLPAPTLTPQALDAAIYDEKPVLPGDNMSVRQLLEAIAEGLTGDYSAAAVASKALEKLNVQHYADSADALAIERALADASVEAHAETLEKMRALEEENARLRAALKPFADACEAYEESVDDEGTPSFEDYAALYWDWELVAHNYSNAFEALNPD